LITGFQYGIVEAFDHLGSYTASVLMSFGTAYWSHIQESSRLLTNQCCITSQKSKGLKYYHVIMTQSLVL